MSYITLHAILTKTKGNFNYATVVFARWFRTFTVIFGTCMILMSFPRFNGGGPLFRESLVKIKQSCERNLMSDILGVFSIHRGFSDLVSETFLSIVYAN